LPSGLIFLEWPAVTGVNQMMGLELLGRLVDEHVAALVLYARQWSAVPEDVVQDAFVKLVSQRPTPHDPPAWLFRVVRNAAISAGRAERRRRHREAEAAAQTSSWLTATDGSSLDAETVAAALQQLPGE
jgi:RNA polymerase sigma-70 factor (ECF subfamily)